MDGHGSFEDGSTQDEQASSTPKENGIKEHTQDASVRIKVEGLTHQMKNAEKGEVRVILVDLAVVWWYRCHSFVARCSI